MTCWYMSCATVTVQSLFELHRMQTWPQDWDGTVDMNDAIIVFGEILYTHMIVLSHSCCLHTV